MRQSFVGTLVAAREVLLEDLACASGITGLARPAQLQYLVLIQDLGAMTLLPNAQDDCRELCIPYRVPA